MKTRSGFVSNSSTSSFIATFKKSIPSDKYKQLIKLITRHGKVCSFIVKDEIKTLEDRNKELKEDIEYCQKIKGRMDKLIDKLEPDLHHLEIFFISSRIRMASVDNLRDYHIQDKHNTECPSVPTMKRVRENLFQSIENGKRVIFNNEQEILRLKEHDKKDLILSWEDDNWGPSELYSLVLDLMAEGLADIVEERI